MISAESEVISQYHQQSLETVPEAVRRSATGRMGTQILVRDLLNGNLKFSDSDFFPVTVPEKLSSTSLELQCPIMP